MKKHAPMTLLALMSPAYGCGEQASSGDEVTRLAERVAVLEAQGGGGGDGADDGAVGDRVSSLEASLQATQEALQATQDALQSTQADLATANDEIGALQADLGAVEAAVDSIDLDTVAGRVSGLEGDITTLDARVAANEVSIDGLGDRGGVWYEEGSGTGTCARVNVVTDSDRPLIVIATVESESTTNGSLCYSNASAFPCSAAASFSDTDTTTVNVVTDNVGGAAFSELFSRTESRETSLSDGSYVTFVSVYGPAARLATNYNSTQSWTTPIQGVLDIPSAGNYTVEVRVTSTASVGSCRLVVLQP
jgi:hypothetical protein